MRIPKYRGILFTRSLAMSRCFPFPPPGYEKKARVDEESLLIKEKKKEKKDREKRDGKEKKEKAKSKERHKEKRNKHKDKKDKHKDKERTSALVEEDNAQPPEHDTAEKVGPSSVQSAQSSDTKFLLELGKRIGNYDERSAEKNLLVHKFTLTCQEKYESQGKDKVEDQRKVNGRENGVVTENGFIHKFEGVHRGTLERVGGLVGKSVEKRLEHVENNKLNNGESRGGEQKERDPEKKIRADLLAEKPIERRTDQVDNNKQKNGKSRAGNHKDKDPERKSKSKDKKRDKVKEKEEGKTEKELKKEQLKQKESGKPAADGNDMKTSSDLLKERSGRFGGEENVGKRKEREANGFLHDTGIRPSKMARPVSSTRQIAENGRMTEPNKTAIRFVEKLEGNKKISSSLSVPGNGRIMEPSPRTVSSTHQIMINGRKPEPSKAAIQIVAEFGEGNKVVTSSCSGPTNGIVTEPCPRPKLAVSTKELMENGREREPGKAAVRVVAEGEGNSKKVLSSIYVAGTGTKMEPPTPSLPSPENGRKLEVSRSTDRSASGRNMVVFNHKVGSKEIAVNGKDEVQQSSFSLKRPSPSSKQDQLASVGNVGAINHKVDNKESTINGKEAMAQQPNVSLKRPSISSKQVKEKVKPKPPHTDSKFLDIIFSIPQVETSSDIDQEWLFGGSRSDFQQVKRPKLGSCQVEETTKQVVWAEALCLEFADIVALPYVIPY